MDAIQVNSAKISPEAIAAEMQYHPAPSGEQAWKAAATTLVIRQLLLAEAKRLAIAVTDDGLGDTDSEEVLVQALLDREIAIEEPDEETSRRYWAANPTKFSTADLYEAAHILFLAAPDDEAARKGAKQAAVETLALLQSDPTRFAALAKDRSACPSAAAGGHLGQLCRGDLDPEIETFALSLEEGQICPVPIATRYGFHLLRLDRLVRGEVLPFEAVAAQITQHLAAQSWKRAVSQYLRVLAGRAKIDGLDMDAATSPLV